MELSRRDVLKGAVAAVLGFLGVTYATNDIEPSTQAFGYGGARITDELPEACSDEAYIEQNYGTYGYGGVVNCDG